MKKIKFMDTSFRDGFQSCYGARVKTEDFLPVLTAAVDAGNYNCLLYTSPSPRDRG